MSINICILLGNVGRDPEIRTLNSGDKVANFSIATSESWRDKQTGERKEKTEWHNISVFNQNIVKVVEQYVKKGSKVGIQGKITTRKWQDKDGNDRYTTEIVIENFNGRLTLEGGKSDGDGEAKERPAQSSAPKGGGGGSLASQLDDDIPFSPEWR